MHDATFKICIFGDSGVGKTTLTQRYLTGLFDSGTTLTIGSNFYRKAVVVEEKDVVLQIWDFGGERQFRRMFPNYFKGSSGAIFMYDITRFVTLKNIDEWMSAIQKNIEDNIPMFMVAGKLDLIDKKAVDKSEALEMAEKYNFTNYMECSAKTGHNVEEIFYYLTQAILIQKGIIEPVKVKG